MVEQDSTPPAPDRRATSLPDGPLVAGELPVPLGQHHRRPHQGVIPVEGQGQAPEEGPDVVSVPEVGELVGEHMGADPPVLRRLRGEVDGGAEHPAQAGGGQAVRLIHRQGTIRQGQRAAALAEFLGKPQVSGQHRQQDHAGPRPPRQHHSGAEHVVQRGTAEIQVDLPIFLELPEGGVLARRAGLYRAVVSDGEAVLLQQVGGDDRMAHGGVRGEGPV